MIDQTITKTLYGIGPDSAIIILTKFSPYLLLALLILTWNKRAIIIGVLGAIVSKLTEIAIQSAWQRPRPFAAMELEPLIAHIADASFPSSHALIGFAISWAVLKQDKKLGIIALAIAGLGSLSRVVLGLHYFTDILAGAIIGIIFVETIWRFWKAPSRSST